MPTIPDVQINGCRARLIAELCFLQLRLPERRSYLSMHISRNSIIRRPSPPLPPPLSAPASPLHPVLEC